LMWSKDPTATPAAKLTIRPHCKQSLRSMLHLKLSANNEVQAKQAK